MVQVPGNTADQGQKYSLGHYLIVGAIVAPVFIGAAYSSHVNTTEKTNPCFSVWDGSPERLVEEVKRKLRDPDSFQHVATRWSDVDGNLFKVSMEYRAKNGFGGYNKEVAYATMVHDTCVVVSWN